MQNLNTKAIAHTKLTQDVDRRDTAMRVENVHMLPAVPFRAMIQNEVIEVHLVSGHTLSKVIRGLEGTQPAKYIYGTPITAEWTDEMIKNLASRAEYNQTTIRKSAERSHFLSVRGLSRFI